MVKRGSVSRRNFLKGAATAGIVSALPTVIPSVVLGENAPSNRIAMRYGKVRMKRFSVRHAK